MIWTVSSDEFVNNKYINPVLFIKHIFIRTSLLLISYPWTEIDMFIMGKKEVNKYSLKTWGKLKLFYTYSSPATVQSILWPCIKVVNVSSFFSLSQIIFSSSKCICINLKFTFLVEFIIGCFAVWWSIYFHLFPFMFISHLWTEEKSEGVAVCVPFIIKSECLQTTETQSLWHTWRGCSRKD